MATFKRSVITKKGKEFISRALSNETKILLNRIESTDYVYADNVDITEVLSLDNPKQNVSVSEITKNKEKVRIRGVLTNEGLQNAYKINALGIYAKDSNNTEILFAILIAENADTISPPQGSTVISITLDFVFVLSDTENVNITVDSNALVTAGMLKDLKINLENNYVKNIDYATEEKHGIAKIYSENEAENTSERVKSIVESGNGEQQEDTGGTFWGKLIESLDHTKILTVNGLVKILRKIIKPATDNQYGLTTNNNIKSLIRVHTPQPDLTPFVPFVKGYRNDNRNDWFVRTNGNDTWMSSVVYMYNSNGSYMGGIHVNGGRFYYKVPNRVGDAWCEIMDNHDMAIRDNRMNAFDANILNIRQLLQDVITNHVREIRLAGYIIETGVQERPGYVLTMANELGNNTVQYGRRALQFYRNGQWVNAYFA